MINLALCNFTNHQTFLKLVVIHTFVEIVKARLK